MPQGRAEVSTAADVRRSYRVHGAIGHSGALQTASRLERRRVGPDGTVYAAGTAIPQRADFNTLDNPFAWSADGSGSGRSCGRRPLRRLQPDERRLQPRPQRDGRRAARRHDAAVRAAGRGPGLQQHPPHDATAELPRPAARPPLVPALRALASGPKRAAATARISPGRSGGTGRRTGLKIRRLKGRGGSIPPFGIAERFGSREAASLGRDGQQGGVDSSVLIVLRSVVGATCTGQSSTTQATGPSEGSLGQSTPWFGGRRVIVPVDSAGGSCPSCGKELPGEFPFCPGCASAD